MRAAQMDGATVTNIIVVDSLDVFPNLIEAGDAAIGDTWNGSVFVKQAVPLVVPQEITSRQAHAALILRGLDVLIDQYIDAIVDPVQRKLTRNEYVQSQVFERQRPLVLQIGAALNLDLDELFIFAAGL